MGRPLKLAVWDALILAKRMRNEITEWKLQYDWPAGEKGRVLQWLVQLIDLLEGLSDREIANYDEDVTHDPARRGIGRLEYIFGLYYKYGTEERYRVLSFLRRMRRERKEKQLALNCEVRIRVTINARNKLNRMKRKKGLRTIGAALDMILLKYD